METAKIKITQYTEAYRTVEPFKTEYQQFLSGRSEKQSFNVKSTKHAQINNGLGVTERLLTEIPETLWAMLFRQLNPEEWTWFNSVEGKTWFANNNKEFSATGRKL